MKTLHRIFTPIIALLTIPAAIFLPFFRIMVAQGTGTTADGGKINILDNFGLGEYISIADLFSFVKGGGSEGSNFLLLAINSLTKNGEKPISEVIPGLHWGIAFLVFLVITIIFALVVAVVAAATRRPGISAWLSAGGILSALIMNATFNAFAEPIVAGALNLDSLFAGMLGEASGLLGALFGMAYSVDYMKLSVAYTAILLLFIVIFIFSAASTFDEKKR